MKTNLLWAMSMFVLIVLVWLSGCATVEQSLPTPSLPTAATSTPAIPSSTFTLRPTVSPTPEPVAPSPTPDPYEERVLISAGPFWMGCIPAHNRGSDYCNDDELPYHEVVLDVYEIDRYEVTNARYARCVAAGICLPPAENRSAKREPYFDKAIFANYPVNFVSWEDARIFCAWAGGRLPSEAEWEKAARGSQAARSYPWGDEEASCRRANFSGGSGCLFDTQPVGNYPASASPYGAHDVAGNVAEWVNDLYDAGYYGRSTITNPPGPARGDLRVLRGGGFESGASMLRTADRYALPGDTHAVSIGFRCAYPVR